MSDFKYVKEYLDTGLGTEGSLLIPRKIYDTLITEVQKALIPRTEAALYGGPAQIPGASWDFNLQTADTLKVRRVAEGAEVPLDQATYTNTNLKPAKYGVALRITQEMLEDANWNLLDHSIMLASKRLAENETNLVITQLQTCTNSVSGGAAITIANICTAMLYLENYDYKPTTMLVGMEVLSDLRQIDTFVEYLRVGNTDMLDKGFLGTVYGMNVIKFSTNAAPSSTYAKYAYVFDKTQAYAIGEKRPITIKGFDLQTYDMSGCIVTQRIAVKLLRDYAVCRISTS